MRIRSKSNADVKLKWTNMAVNRNQEKDKLKDDSLERLRQRATCSICKQIYKQPKRNCRHVFCLSCIKQYMSKRPENFPPCPMCRTFIKKPLQEISTLERAVAEEDIVTVVKRFEKCDLCNMNENPEIRCFECNRLICERCIPSHDQINPFHRKMSVSLGLVSSVDFAADKCSKHKDQLLNLYCVMCERPLCLLCDQYCPKHSKCKEMYKGFRGQQHLKKLFSTGFLLGFMQSDDDRREQLQSAKIPLCVSFRDFSEYCRRWLGGVKENVDDLLKFLKEYGLHIGKLGIKTNDAFAASLRADAIVKEVNCLVDIGENMLLRVTNLLESPNDTQCVTSVKDIEQKYIVLLKTQTLFTFETIPIAFVTDTLEFDKTVHRQISKCKPETKVGVFGGIICSNDFSEVLENFNVKDIGIYDNAGGSARIVSLFFQKSNTGKKSYSFTEYDCTVEYFDNNEKSSSIPNICKAENIGKNVYKSSAICRLSENSCNHIRTIETRPSVRLCSIPVHEYFRCSKTLETPIVNTYLLVRHDHERSYSECIIRTRNSSFGLETVLYNSESATQIRVSLCLIVTRVKMKERILNTKSFTCEVFHDINKNFSVFLAYGGNSAFTLSYSTAVNDVPDSESSFSENESSVSGKSLKADLMCSLKKGLYIVTHTSDVLTVGRIQQTALEIDVLCTVRKQDIGIPVDKLIPLTAVENAKDELVVAFSVEDDNTKFLMLWPGKKGKKTVEILEVEYLSTDIGEAKVVDFEMDQDGQVVFVLEKQGVYACFSTRYFMP